MTEFWQGFLCCTGVYSIIAFFVWVVLFSKSNYYDYDEIGRDTEDEIYNQELK